MAKAGHARTSRLWNSVGEADIRSDRLPTELIVREFLRV